MNDLAAPGLCADEYRRRDLARQPPARADKYPSTHFRSPAYRPISLPALPSDSYGPVFDSGLAQPGDNDLTTKFACPGQSAIDERILVHGRPIDEHGRGIDEALIEVWQANADGRYRHPRDTCTAPLDPDLGGCRRVLTDQSGGFSLNTIKPGPYPWLNGGNDWRPLHIHFSVFGHGFVQRLVTRMYFEGDPLISMCPIFGTTPDRQAAERLVARFDHDNTIPMDRRAYRFDIVLRGRDSTMFENRMEGSQDAGLPGDGVTDLRAPCSHWLHTGLGRPDRQVCRPAFRSPHVP